MDETVSDAKDCEWDKLCPLLTTTLSVYAAAGGGQWTLQQYNKLMLLVSASVPAAAACVMPGGDARSVGTMNCDALCWRHELQRRHVEWT